MEVTLQRATRKVLQPGRVCLAKYDVLLLPLLSFLTHRALTTLQKLVKSCIPLDPYRLSQLNVERKEGQGPNVTSAMQHTQQETILAPRDPLCPQTGQMKELTLIPWFVDGELRH